MREQAVEFDGVAPEPCCIRPNRRRTGRNEHILGECPADLMQRLPQRTPRPVLGKIRPEEGHECLAGRCGMQREVGEKRKPLGLREHPAHLAASGVTEVHLPQDAQPEHGPMAHRW